MENEKSGNCIYGYDEIIRYKDFRDDSNDFINKKKVQILFKDNQKINQKVVKMVFTDSNQFILTSNGNIYSRGKGEISGGKILFKNHLLKNFERIKFPESEQNKIIIYDISAGSNHVLALDDKGSIFGWGKNDFLQVNPKEKDINYYKMPILIPVDYKIYSVQKIFALRNSSYAVCKNNKLISWGEVNKNFIKEGNNIDDFKLYSELSDLLYNIFFKDSNNFTDSFLDSEQKINPNYIYPEEVKEESQLKKLNNKLVELKNEINLKKQKQNLMLTNMKIMEKTDDKISVIFSTIKQIDNKLNKRINEKDQIHKQLIRINEEINQEKANM